MIDYTPVPVSAAKAIADKYGKSLVIVLAWDEEHRHLHTTTYGADAQNKAWAAQGGEIATKALGALRVASVEFEDYRLEQARKLLRSLKSVFPMIEAMDIGREPDDENIPLVEEISTVIREAESFLKC